MYIHLNISRSVYLYKHMYIDTYPPKLSQVFPCDFFVFGVEDVLNPPLWERRWALWHGGHRADGVSSQGPIPRDAINSCFPY